MLALAHHVERQIEAGAIPDYAAAARALGLTRARLTQVMKLLLLSPEIQEGVLVGELRATERSLRGVVGEAEWGRQQARAETSPPAAPVCRPRYTRSTSTKSDGDSAAAPADRSGGGPAAS